MNIEPIVQEALIDASISRIWRAITDVDEMSKWYMVIKSFKPVVGIQFTFYGAANDEEKYNHTCRITEVVPEKKLAYTWEYENLPGSSVVTFELQEEAGKTRVKLTHEGVESFSENGPDFIRENFIKGWNHLLSIKLKKYLEDPHFFIERSIQIDSSPERVWEVLTTIPLTRKWTCGFGEGVYIETDFKRGSEVLWKMGEGTVCAKGVVTILEPANEWKTDFYGYTDDGKITDEFGVFSEDFKLAEQDGKTVLSIRSGPFNAKWHDMIYPGWDKALPLIKETAEGNSI